VAELTLAYPLPCEDPLAAVRRSHTVARDLGGFKEGNHTNASDFLEHTARAPYGARAVATAASLVHSSLAQHALLGLVRPSGEALGFCLLPLPEAGAATVSAPLTRGGRREGTVTALVAVSRRAAG